MGLIRSCDKSDLVDCLLELSDRAESSSAPLVQAKILDGAAIVRMLRPGPARTFGEYAKNVFMPYVRKEACESEVCRIDIVWDRFIPGSLKTETRNKRGSGTKIQLAPSTEIPKEAWQKFLSNSENKRKLFELLADEISSATIPGVQLISTKHKDAVSSTRDDMDILRPCNHEEADTRILLHVADAANQGITRVLVRSRDTDVLVLCVANLGNIPGLEELWVSTGTSSYQKYLAVHELTQG